MSYILCLRIQQHTPRSIVTIDTPKLVHGVLVYGVHRAHMCTHWLRLHKKMEQLSEPELTIAAASVSELSSETHGSVLLTLLSDLLQECPCLFF